MIKGPPPAYLDSHPLTFFINMGSKRLTSCRLYAILFPVMRDIDNTDRIERGYEEVCTGCGETVCLSKEEHDEWDHGFDNFMCWECE